MQPLDSYVQRIAKNQEISCIYRQSAQRRCQKVALFGLCRPTSPRSRKMKTDRLGSRKMAYNIHFFDFFLRPLYCPELLESADHSFWSTFEKIDLKRFPRCQKTRCVLKFNSIKVHGHNTMKTSVGWVSLEAQFSFNPLNLHVYKHVILLYNNNNNNNNRINKSRTPLQKLISHVHILRYMAN